MLRVAAKVTPWPLLGVASLLLALMLHAVEQWPYVMWPLQGIAVGLVAGAAAFSYDEPAAAVVDTLPRGLAWRTAARSLGVLPLLGWWLLVVAVTADGYFGHAPDVAWQGVAATVAVVAAVTHLRHRGAAGPATGIATALLGATAYLALTRPVEDLLPVFPYTPGGLWAEGRLLWTVVLVGGAAWLVATLRR